MTVKQRKIYMNGNFWGQYNLSTKSYLKLQYIRFKLWCVRWGRRLHRGINYCKYVLILLPFWLLFAVILKIWGTYRLGAYSWGDILWDMKLSIFTSIALSLVTSFISQYNKNKTMYLAKHEQYIRIMGKMSDLFKELYILLFNDNRKSCVPFWPFFLRNMNDEVYSTLNAMEEFEIANPDSLPNVLFAADRLRDELSDLRTNIYQGGVFKCSVHSLVQLLATNLSELDEVCQLLVTRQRKRHFGRTFNRLYDDLYSLLEELRWPWRRDLPYKVQALSIIYQEDQSIAGTFYNSAFLNVVNYKEYEELLTYIDQIKAAAKKQSIIV